MRGFAFSKQLRLAISVLLACGLCAAATSSARAQSLDDELREVEAELASVDEDRAVLATLTAEVRSGRILYISPQLDDDPYDPGEGLMPITPQLYSQYLCSPSSTAR